MLEFITEEMRVFLLSLLPVSEIRGAMIYAFSAGLTTSFIRFIETFLISVIGNFIPVPFIILLFRPIIKWAQTTRIFGGPANWLENRARKKAAEFKSVSMWALFIFVAIPFPTTGAWTGAMIAALFDIRFRYSLPAILAGIVVAGIVVSLLSAGILNLGALNNIFL
ncbi:MAG: small multi-drug export protein [Clostridia bacterium]|nr:small multi-drug export protein [Clostridia bacterium]